MHASISRLLLLTGGLLFASGVHAQLDPGTMDGHLAAGAPIFGTFEQSNGQLANWMAGFEDSLAIERLNIPGTHDSAAWNYTQLGAAFVVTQDKPLFDQLDSGIRFFDLRIGLNNGVINFYHGSALLSASASLEDIFWGFYHWLDAHPTETLLVSIKVDNGPESPELQQTVYNLMTGADTAAYWVQSQTLGTLGEARKKIILFRRFSFDALTDVTPIGLNFATGWQDNNPSFSISYGEERFAFIEDYYDVEGATTSDKIAAKFAALTANVESAMTTNDTQLFISFASGFSGVTVTPKILAEGNSSMSGINSQSLDWLESHRGSRFGVILFDFFASEAGLVNATIGFENGPRQPKPSSSASAGPSGSTNDAITFRRGYLIETCILGLGLGFFLPF